MAKRPNIKKTTIVDIARACGVSVATVSRILNNKPDVADETRQRVLLFMEEQGFSPQIAWQQLRSGKSRFIALHFPQDFNPPSHRIITSAAMGCENAGYSLNLIANSLTPNELLAVFRRGQADGIILMEILTHDWRVNLLREQGIPFVMIGRCADNTGLSYVDVDIARGVQDAIQHLYALGHRQIGFVTLAPMRQEKEYGFTTWAVKGYQAACEQFGLPELRCTVDLNMKDPSTVVVDLLDRHPEITAIVTPQEIGIAGVLKAIQLKKLRIFEDVSVVGLLDGSMSELLSPPLSTISFPSSEMGFEAVKILISDMTSSPSIPQQILIRPGLVVRGSIGPARAG